MSEMKYGMGVLGSLHSNEVFGSVAVVVLIRTHRHCVVQACMLPIDA